MSDLGNWLQVNLRGASKHAPVFEVFKDAGDNWRWHERAANGQIVGTAGEAYSSKAHAKRAAYAMAVKMPGTTVKVL